MELYLKKTVLYTALSVLVFPACLQALGLGEMKVESALDQPFVAEIELIDVNSAPITNIKANLASPQYFERLGIVPCDALSLLQFDVKKNARGRLVIWIHSTERVSEPYIQLVVDLTWPSGQLYKTYTVLLDPPGYKLDDSSPTYHQRVVGRAHERIVSPARTKHVADSPDNSGKETYGPTVANENVWQIAQRYKTEAVILPQVVLAIVGQNPDAFTERNLNGLKAGAKLNVPSIREILKVPADLATVEVMAHDKAWNEKNSINHVLSPPYTMGQTLTKLPVVEYSKILPVPQFTQSKSTAIEVMPRYMLTSDASVIQNQKPISAKQDATLKAEISITTAAVDSLRESNAALLEQLHMMQSENKTLHEQLAVRDKEIKLIRNQIQVMKKERLAIAAQASSGMNKESSSVWPFLLLFAVAGSGGAAFWHFKRWKQKGNDSSLPAIPPDTESVAPILKPIEQPELHEPKLEPKPLVSVPFSRDQPGSMEAEAAVNDYESFQAVAESPQDNALEFESGLHQLLTEKSITTAIEGNDMDERLVFEPITTAVLAGNSEAEEINVLKSTNALDTLLDLARTYLGMGDKESALYSLNEVLVQGTDAQKEVAKNLMAEIKSNDFT